MLERWEDARQQFDLLDSTKLTRSHQHRARYNYALALARLCELAAAKALLDEIDVWPKDMVALVTRLKRDLDG